MRVLASIPRQRLFSSCLWIFLACLVAYANIYGNRFLWDDLDLIVKNYEIRSLFPLSKFIFSTSTIPQRPVMNLSFALDFGLWGLNPAGYHLTQILLHTLNSVAVMLLLLRLLGSRQAAFFAGLLFALHPVHSEAVTAFLGRSELLMAFFGLLAVGAFIYNLKNVGLKAWLAYSASLTAFGASCLSKETGIVTPLLCLLIFLLSPSFRGRHWLWRSIFLRLCPFVALAFLYLLYRSSVIRSIPRSWWGGSPVHNFMMMFTIVWEYTRLLFFPHHLSPWYITSVPTNFWDWNIILGIIILIAGVFLIVFLRQKAWILSMSIGWILLALLPVSNLIPIPGSMMAERWLYLPSVGFCWMAGYLLASLLERLKGWKLVRTVVLIGLCSLGVVSLIRVWTWNAVWHDGERLFKVMFSRNDENTLAHDNLGDIYLEQRRFHEGIREYAATLFYQPLAPRAYEGLGSVFWAQELRNDALTEFHRAVALDPDFTQAHYSLGLALAETGDTAEAVQEIQGVLKKEPLNPVPNEALGSLLLASGRPQDALSYFSLALTSKPKDAELHFKAGQAFVALGKWTEGEWELRKSLSLDPHFWRAYEVLAFMYEKQGRWREADQARKEFLNHDSL